MDAKLALYSHVMNSAEHPPTNEYYANNRDQLSSLKRSNRDQLSAFRTKTDEEYEGHNSTIFRSIQHIDPAQSLDVSQMSSGQTLQLK